MSTILKVDNLFTEIKIDNKNYTAVSDVSFSLNSQETLGFVGESGCGKSLTALSITKLLGKNINVTSGTAMFDGVDLFSLSAKEMRKLRGNKISMIFQEPMTALNPVLTIGDQMREMIMPHLKLNKKDATKKAISLLADMGIERAEDIVKNYPFQLSGGMLQRVMIAMSLSCNPQILIADEPTTALDVTIQAQILKLMSELKDKYNTSIIIISHNLGVVAQVCDRVAVMYYGEIVETAPVSSLFEKHYHPYTTGLFACIPKLDLKEESLDAIPGVVPTLMERTNGCAFAPRCNKAFEKCHNNHPQLVEVAEGHFCRCFLHEDTNNANKG